MNLVDFRLREVLGLGSGTVSDLASRTLSVLASVPFCGGEAIKFVLCGGPRVSSVSEELGGEVVMAVEKGVGDSFKTQTLCALRCRTVPFINLYFYFPLG